MESLFWPKSISLCLSLSLSLCLSLSLSLWKIIMRYRNLGWHFLLVFYFCLQFETIIPLSSGIFISVDNFVILLLLPLFLIGKFLMYLDMVVFICNICSTFSIGNTLFSFILEGSQPLYLWILLLWCCFYSPRIPITCILSFWPCSIYVSYFLKTCVFHYFSLCDSSWISFFWHKFYFSNFFFSFV